MQISKCHVKNVCQKIVDEYQHEIEEQIQRLNLVESFNFSAELQYLNESYYKAVNKLRGIRELVFGIDTESYFMVDSMARDLRIVSEGHSKNLLSLWHNKFFGVEESASFFAVGPVTETVLLPEVA